jgi:hypothetical protein
MRAGMRVACGRVCDAAESSDLSSSEKPHVINDKKIENQSQSKREKVSVRPETGSHFLSENLLLIYPIERPY